MRKNTLENRVPPPLVLLVCMICVWLGYRSVGGGEGSSAEFWRAGVWGVPYVLFGLAVIILGIIQFRIQRTTVNPLDPQQATSLVAGGVFSYTRNPMYLGMALILLGQIISLGWLPGFLLLLFFILYIQVFQILPEERAMQELFGKDFDQYCSEVRRWL